VSDWNQMVEMLDSACRHGTVDLSVDARRSRVHSTIESHGFSQRTESGTSKWSVECFWSLICGGNQSHNFDWLSHCNCHQSMSQEALIQLRPKQQQPDCNLEWHFQLKMSSNQFLETNQGVKGVSSSQFPGWQFTGECKEAKVRHEQEHRSKQS